MSELVSAYPTAGGIYWWASKLGGPAWGWFTGWFNLIGLDRGDRLGRLRLRDVPERHASALFDVNLFNGVSATRRLPARDVLAVRGRPGASTPWSTSPAATSSRASTAISVWWHVAGVAVILVVLIFVPDHHATARLRLHRALQQLGLQPDSMFWFYVLPLGFLLTQYTITGFDSCAHISEETHGAADDAAKGVWRSIFYSAVFGWILLLAITFAATNVDAVNKDAAGGAYVAVAILKHALDAGVVQVRADHLDGRAALLRRRVPDQRLAHVLRVQPRRRDPRLADLEQGQPRRGSRSTR